MAVVYNIIAKYYKQPRDFNHLHQMTSAHKDPNAEPGHANMARRRTTHEEHDAGNAVAAAAAGRKVYVHLDGGGHYNGHYKPRDLDHHRHQNKMGTRTTDHRIRS